MDSFNPDDWASEQVAYFDSIAEYASDDELKLALTNGVAGIQYPQPVIVQSGTDVGLTSITFEVEPSAGGAPNLQYTWKLASSLEWAALQTITGLSATIPDLTSNTLYDVKMRYADASTAAFGRWLIAADARTASWAAPVVSKASNTGVSITVSIPSFPMGADLGQYEIRLAGTTDDFLFEQSGLSNVFATSAPGVPLIPDTAYEIRARYAQNSGTEVSGWSAVVTFHTWVAPTFTVINVAATTADVSISTALPTGADKYRVSYKKTADPDFTDVDSVTSPVALTGLTTATGYDVKVAVIDSVTGEVGQYSAVQNFTTL